MPKCRKVSKCMKTRKNDAKLVKNHLNQLISGDPGPAGTQARRGTGPGGDPGPAGCNFTHLRCVLRPYGLGGPPVRVGGAPVLGGGVGYIKKYEETQT